MILFCRLTKMKIKKRKEKLGKQTGKTNWENKLGKDGKNFMIYFVRHGQTDDNVKHIISGAQRDVPLNDTGILQAKDMARKVKDLKLDQIFCSPMKRARQTLREIAKFHKNVPICYDDRLVERFHGVLEGQLDTTANHWDMNNQPHFEGLETIEEMYARVKSFLDEINEKNPHKNVLIVGHNGVGVLLKCHFYGFPKSGDLRKCFVDNTEILEFEN